MSGDMGDMGGMMNFVKQAQERAARMREEMERSLAALVVEGSAGGGMVKVSMNGAFQVRGVSIDPEVIDANEKDVLEDLVAAALNQALKKAKEAQAASQQQQLGDLTQGMGGLPGMGGIDLSKIFGA